MFKNIEHIPEDKQVELAKIVNIIRSTAKPEMIILFGSFARGDWVEDRYTEDYITYEYKSDFDILVVVSDLSSKEIIDMTHKIEMSLNKEKNIITPISIIVDNISFINEQLEIGRYFYSDIKKEGIVLYDSKKYSLSQPKKLSQKEKKKIAKEDYEKWFPKALQALQIFSFCITKKPEAQKYILAERSTLPKQIEISALNWGAFHLHQAVESLLIVVLLVFTGYRPKTHNISKLLELVSHVNMKFKDIFPLTSTTNKRMFNLLKKAYIDARYDKTYSINKKELEYLEEHVQQLKDLVEKVCEKKIG